jgi:hypothetical protein
MRAMRTSKPRTRPCSSRRSTISAFAGGILAAAAILAGAKPAAAQAVTIGSQRSFMVSGEDMVGYFSEHVDYKDQNNLDFSATRNYLSLPFRTAGVKLGLHYFVVPGLSLGGSVGFESRSGSNTYQDVGGVYTRSIATGTTFLLQPKAGYLLMLTPVAGFWFRAGLGFRYDRNRANDYQPDSNITDSSWHVSGDVLFVITPVPHFGFYIGPTGDLSLTGTHHEHIVDPPNPPVDWSHSASYSRLGLGMGMLGYF